MYWPSNVNEKRAMIRMFFFNHGIFELWTDKISLSVFETLIVWTYESINLNWLGFLIAITRNKSQPAVCKQTDQMIKI